MGVAAAVITAVGAVAGAGISAAGAAQNADKAKSMAWASIQNQRAFTKYGQQEIDKLADEKLTKLQNSGDVIGRLGGGIFGSDPQVEKDIRESQANFAALASGNFDGFESLLRSSIQKNLAGSNGSPIGTFTRLSAQDQFDFMQAGLKNALATSEFFSNQTNNLLGIEFGIMDQRTNTKLQLKQNEVAATNQALTGAASSAGMGTVALGQGVTQATSAIGQAFSNYNKIQNANQIQGDLLAAINNIKTIPVSNTLYAPPVNNPVYSGTSNPYIGYNPTAAALPDVSFAPVVQTPMDMSFDSVSIPNQNYSATNFQKLNNSYYYDSTSKWANDLVSSYEYDINSLGPGVLPPL